MALKKKLFEFDMVDREWVKGIDAGSATTIASLRKAMRAAAGVGLKPSETRTTLKRMSHKALMAAQGRVAVDGLVYLLEIALRARARRQARAARRIMKAGRKK